MYNRTKGYLFYYYENNLTFGSNLARTYTAHLFVIIVYQFLNHRVHI